MSTTPQDALREAARILMRDGWTQGTISDKRGRRCRLGAVCKAAESLRASTYVFTGAEDLFGRWLFAEYGTAETVKWNDAPERTAEDVILALKRAAEET